MKTSIKSVIRKSVDKGQRRFELNECCCPGLLIDLRELIKYFFQLLTALVEMYEEQNYPISPPDPIEAIKFRMDQLGLGQKDMVP